MSAEACAAFLRRVEDTVGLFLFGAMLIVVPAQVFVRFLLYEWLQIAWADEIGRALLVWSSFWGAVLVTRESHHITIDLLYERLSVRAQSIIVVIADLVMSVFLVVVLWNGAPILADSLRRPSPATNLPAFIFDGALGVSGALMIAHIAMNALQRWRPNMAGDVPPRVRGESS